MARARTFCLVLVLAVAAAACGTVRAPAPELATATHSAAGITVALPPGWRAVAPHQPAQITDPLSQLVIASGPGVTVAPTGCQVASYDVPDEVAVVVLLEWRELHQDGRIPGGPAARVGFPLLAPPAVVCFDGRGGTTQFRDAGRTFGVYLMLGDAATPATEAAARAAIASITAAPRS